MKKYIFYLLAAITLPILQSCGDFKPGRDKSGPDCIWDENNQVVFYDLELKHPSGLSNSHDFALPIDKTLRSLRDVFDISNGAAQTTTSKISGLIIADRTSCQGSQPFEYKKGSNSVTANSIKIPFVSNVIFEGEVKVEMRSNTFYNEVGNGLYYYIL